MRTSTIVWVLSAASMSVGVFSTSSLVVADDIIATDTASNYTTWTNGSNGGMGFSPWSISLGGTATTSIASSPIGTSSWEMNANDSSSIFVTRNFPNVPKGAIYLDLDASPVDAGGSLAILFFDSDHAPAFELSVDPSKSTSLHPAGSDDYLFSDGTGAAPIDTGIVANGDATHLDFKFDTITNTYVTTLTQTGGGSYISDPNPSPLSGPAAPIDEIAFIDSGAGADSPFYINNITVVPLPVAAMGAAPLLAFLVARRTYRQFK